ncbi:hypothetical protein [Nocardia otitidiscaviarum]|uniref:hypothetical protein n=1 Tax=Nocardia otitidiscaviarum TaxID=1823 RepID=UPI0004A725D7|nr:hypothetical protein [Nocardia otitidiscaviarum]
MFNTIQHTVPRDFRMDAVRVIETYATNRGWATVEAWDTPDGRLFYALDETDNLLAPATQRKVSAILAVRRYVDAGEEPVGVGWHGRVCDRDIDDLPED